jgi:hypothetical protein
VAVLSHALLLIASLFASPVCLANANANANACQSVPSRAYVEHSERAWAQGSDESNVKTFGALRTRDTASLRVLGRCVVKPAPENSRPVLFGSFTAQIDDPDDEVLARTRAETDARFAHPASIGPRPTEMYVPRAAPTQLERPPRA